MDSKKLMNIKNFIKEEDPRGTRLQSLRLPRDLSLGGTKNPKKVYTPNLNVVRNKDKTKEFLKKEHIRRGRINEKQNRQNNNKQRYVQSTGVFSEGAGEARKHYSEKRVSFRDNDAIASMVVPTIKRNTWTVNKKEENVVYDDLMGDDCESDDEKMAFAPITWSEQDLKDVKVQRNSLVNGELLEIKQEGNLSTDITKLKLRSDSYLPQEYHDDESYSDLNPTLTVWNLPDSFAGKGLSDDPNVKKLFDYPLSDMLEGKIGKMCVRRSGKVEVYIGRIKYDLEPTDLATCAEDLVALNIKDSYQQPSAAVLGQVQNRFILNPDWESLLH